VPTHRVAHFSEIIDFTLYIYTYVMDLARLHTRPIYLGSSRCGCGDMFNLTPEAASVVKYFLRVATVLIIIFGYD
jgi:hypothetical protein